MSCTNCFNGCAETVSDQCIKYTGIDVPALGILNGDTLLSVENSIINFLVPVLNGTGIKPIVDEEFLCTVVHKYLPPCTVCTGFTLNEVLAAIIQAACDIQEQIDVIDGTLSELNSIYLIPQIPNDGPCLDVTDTSNTHEVVQEILYKLCEVSNDLNALILEVDTQYVTRGELCTLVTQCINNSAGTALASSKMLPFSPIPYYGSISNYPAAGDGFNSSGAGTGYWARVFMCNGQNGTPDLRGRVAVGATNTPSAVPCPPETLPNSSGNPTYTIGGNVLLWGSNTTVLAVTQIPSHTHIATVTVNDPGHTHSYQERSIWTNSVNNGGNGQQPTNSYVSKTSGSAVTGLNGTNILVSNANAGGNGWHSNVQPSFAVYYIMYIPA